jgi:hypothetical protein
MTSTDYELIRKMVVSAYSEILTLSVMLLDSINIDRMLKPKDNPNHLINHL